MSGYQWQGVPIDGVREFEPLIVLRKTTIFKIGGSMNSYTESNFADLSLNEENDELYIDIYVTYNDFGNVYTQVKVSDMIKFLKDNKLI